MEASKVPVPPSNHGSGGLFSGSRYKPFPSAFPSHPTAATTDVLYVGILTAFLVIFLSFVTIFPTFMGVKEKVKVFLRVICAMTLGLVIMACNYGQEWEVGVIRTETPYRAGSGQGILAEVGLHFGLRSANVTLKALEEPRGALAGEKIDYNERFPWTWGQGNAGFGPNAGVLQRTFRQAQEKGLPLPILWVAEYLVIDGEGIRFGRHYRTSGWYAHICVWTAFSFWILTMILFKLVIRLAAQALTLTGLMLLSASLIWACNRNFTELQIVFQDGILTTSYGVHWYLSLLMGTLCTIVGLTIYLYDCYRPNELSWVFGNNPLSIVEQETKEEVKMVPTLGADGRKMTMKKAGRRVVTVLRVTGTSHCLKTVTHAPSVDYASESMDMKQDEDLEPKAGPSSASSDPEPSRSTFPPRKTSLELLKDMPRLSLHQSFDNPMFEEDDDEPNSSTPLLANRPGKRETQVDMESE